MVRKTMSARFYIEIVIKSPLRKEKSFLEGLFGFCRLFLAARITSLYIAKHEDYQVLSPQPRGGL